MNKYRPRGMGVLEYWLNSNQLDFIPMTGCWLSHASLNGAGYPWVRVSNIGMVKLGHLVLEQKIGRKLKTLSGKSEEVMRHLCHNKLCVNPDHLEVGDPPQNRADTMLVGRQAKGEKNGRAELTEVEVRQIRLLYLFGEYNKSELARMFSRGWTTINNVIMNRTWKHVDFSQPLQEIARYA